MTLTRELILGQGRSDPFLTRLMSEQTPGEPHEVSSPINVNDHFRHDANVHAGQLRYHGNMDTIGPGALTGQHRKLR
ncbi:unnamed protein product [Lota lota]